MAEATATATPDVDPAAALGLVQGSFMQEWVTGEESPVELATAPGETPDVAPAATPPATEEEPAAPASDPPTDAAAEKPPRNWEELTADLTKDEIDALVKSNPALKRRLDGELGSRLQQREAAIREEAAKKAVEAHDARIAAYNTAAEEYERIERLRDENPAEYERDWANNDDYFQWKASVIKEHKALTTKAPPPPADAGATRDEHWDSFNTMAIPEAKEILAAQAPWYRDMPIEHRRNIEGLAFNREENWLEGILGAFVKGTEAVHEKKLKDAVAAAREAGKNEALAEHRPDTPLSPAAATTGKPLSAHEVLIEHGMNGHKNITRAQLTAAYAELGMNY